VSAARGVFAGAELVARELSARGRGAICVLEVRGPGALARVQPLVAGRELRSGVLACLPLRDARGDLLDEAIVLVETPERVELHLHGAPALVASVRRALALEGDPSPASASLEERARERLAEAASEAAARVLLDQVEGALRAGLERVLAGTDVELVAAARALATRGRVARHLVRPPRVVLAGPVNAGKSTLFNALVGRERAVVDPAAGTTRDAVRERIRLGAYAFELVDTAGERALDAADGEAGTEAGVERAGQVLARDLRRAADLVLWMCPPGSDPPERLAPHELVLWSRADELAQPREPSLAALADPHGARAVVETVVLDALGLPAEPWEPGSPVPFESEWVETLARASATELRVALRSWLGGPASEGRAD
jgi:tRNA modification GTPase